MDVFVARQPIFDINKAVVAYELLYRDSAANFFNSEIGATKATSILLSNSYFNFGIEMLLEDKRAFINFDKVLIKNEVPLLLDKSKIVVEILEDVIPDKNFMTKLKELKNSGYTLALDDFTIDYPYKEIIEIVDIIKVDFMLSSKEDIKKIIKKYSNGNKKFLAEKIENVDEFNNAVSLGYDYFQGYFFSKPIMVQGKKIESLEISYIKLTNEINKEEPNYKIIASIIESDLDMSYKLLKIVNSYSLSSKVNSIPHAVSLMGISELRKWASLVLIGELSFGKPTEVLRLSILRSKFAELLAEKSSYKPKKHELALVGLFSMIDVLLQKPLDTIFSQLRISDEVQMAIKLDSKSELFPIYKLVIDYEMGNWEEIDKDIKSLKILRNIPDIYIQAVKTTDDIVKFIKE